MAAVFVGVRFSKAALSDPAFMRRVARPMAVARATAVHIKRRVSIEGNTATPAPQYSARDNKYYTLRRYAEKVNLRRYVWPSSAKFHQAAGTKHGTYRVTGGMWDGLTVRNYGLEGAIIAFDGTSQGKSQGKTKAKTSAGLKKVADRSRQVMVRNAIKAQTVFRQHNVGLVQPTDAETLAQVDALTWAAQRAVADAFGAEYDPHVTGGDAALFRAILKELRR